MLTRYLTALTLLCALPAAQAQIEAQTPAQTVATAPAQTAAQTDASMATMTAAQKAQLAPRRESEQVVAAPLPTVTQGYRPTLTPATPPGVPNQVGTLPVRPATDAPLPVPVTNCTAGGCTGADGVRYNTGAAGVTVDAAGRTCRKVGTTVQCS